MAGIKHIKTRPMARLLLLVLLAAALTAGSASADKVDIDSFTSSSIKTYGYKIINSYPHDPNAFTQGLEYDDGLLYEGTGGYGQSSLRRVDIQTGRVVDIVHLED
ncbi:glutaminyl-peptide cyclotransferase, partial [Methanothrix soehngenii]|uniref:glutaminyl-peptide cyclotransferase n=1 Tax=Methanothrix soehngenii TaxID=2223 RepID=UPI002FE1C97F